jgi:hypothetical protein
MHPKAPSRTSDILLALAANGDSARVSVGEIVSALGDRTFALLLVVLALPSCLPMPPPIPLISGLLLAGVAIQIAIGRKVPWLPQALLNRGIERTDLTRAITRALPWLQRLEGYAKPRFGIFESAAAMRVVGMIVLAFALSLLVAAPFVGQIPLGIAMCLMGLGIVERDGAVVVAGMILGFFGTSLALGFVFAIASGASALF